MKWVECRCGVKYNAQELKCFICGKINEERWASLMFFAALFGD